MLERIVSGLNQNVTLVINDNNCDDNKWMVSTEEIHLLGTGYLTWKLMLSNKKVRLSLSSSPEQDFEKILVGTSYNEFGYNSAINMTDSLKKGMKVTVHKIAS